MNKVSVIIVNWNTKNYLDKCLHSLETNAGDRITLEIIVIDNNSSDESVTMIKENYPSVELIKNKDNVGFARANNIGIEKASGKYILLLNPDTEIFENSIEKMVEVLRKDNAVGAVGPMILEKNGNIQLTCARNYPTLLTEFFWISTLSRRLPHNKIIGRYLMSYWNHKNSKEVSCLSGACMLVRAGLLKGLNGFDENFFMYGEDVDLCYRINQKGYKIFYEAESKIYHYGGASSEKVTNKAVVYDRQSVQIFFKKHKGLLYALSYRLECLLLSFIMSSFLFVFLFFYWRSNRWKMKKIFIELMMVFLWSIKMEKLVV
jgi:hypothetical protein